MIQRFRNEPPAGLLTAHQEWIETLALDPSKKSSDEWRRLKGGNLMKLVRESLVEMYQGKCCYCEHKSTSHPIDHYIPHTRNPAMLLDYTNLHLVCTLCNGHKSNKDIKGIINPSSEDPRDHITFASENAKDLTTRGLSTIEGVGLNDPNLSNLRQEELRKVERNINQILIALENGLENISKNTWDLLKLMVSNIKDDNLSDSSQFSRMFEVNLKSHIEKIDGILDQCEPPAITSP